MSTKTQKEKEVFLSHFPKKISAGIKKYIDEVALPRQCFLFIKRVQGIQTAYCTRCNKQYMPSHHLQEKAYVKCEKCQTECLVKASGRSRKPLIYHTYLVYYEKSRKNPNAITATGYLITRDYREQYINVEPEIEIRHRYLFQAGQEAILYNCRWEVWERYGQVRSFFSSNYAADGYGGWARTICPAESIDKAVQGTPFQYSMWKEYCWQQGDMVKFFALYCQSPCVEYLTKLGMKYFVNARLDGSPTYGAINWRGKSIQQVLKITKQQFKELQPYMHKNELHPLSLRLQQLNQGIALAELNVIANRYDDCFEDLKKMLQYANLRRADHYICKQLEYYKERYRQNNIFSYSFSSVIRDWKDYIADCLKLEMDVKDDSILFPRDLHEAHQKTIEKVKHKADAELNQKIAMRLSSLKRRYLYQKDGLLLRPIIDTAELINEGNKLHHCVGGYAKKYADGSCVILALRMSAQPDEPFFTMEIAGGQVRQCRGLRNCEMPPAVKEFVDSFVQDRLQRKQPPQIKANRQEAVV